MVAVAASTRGLARATGRGSLDPRAGARVECSAEPTFTDPQPMSFRFFALVALAGRRHICEGFGLFAG